jgi:TonB family protein
MKRWVISAVIVAATTGVVVRAADDLSTARDLYASAAYEEALETLNRVRAAGTAPADAFAVEQYRVFCLLALGRGAEAQTAIESLVVADPLYQPSSDVSPRVRTAFSDVRRRLLPVIIPQQYAKAKAAFDRKDYAVAAAGFNQVLAVLADADVVQFAGQPPLSDLRTLAAGFQELSTKAIPLPPLPAAPPPASPTTTATSVPSVTLPPRVYTIADTRVAMPAPIRQDLPSYSGRLSEPAMGALEVVIDELGRVESAKIRESVNPTYDKNALDATRFWRYRPATLDGVPVKFRKLISVTIKPT